MMSVLAEPLLTRPPPHQVRGIGSSFDDLGENVHDEVRRLRAEGKTASVSKERANGTHSVYFEEVSCWVVVVVWLSLSPLLAAACGTPY